MWEEQKDCAIPFLGLQNLRTLFFWKSPTKVDFFLHKVDVESSSGFLPQLPYLHSHHLSNEGAIEWILVHAFYSFLHFLRKEIITFVQLSWRALVSEMVQFGDSDLQGLSPLHVIFWCLLPMGLQPTVLFELQVQCFAPEYSDKTNAPVWNFPCQKWMELCCSVLGTGPMSSGRMEGAPKDLSEMWGLDLSSPTNLPNFQLKHWA